jgi:Domain of unknown function (DUF2017)
MRLEPVEVELLRSLLAEFEALLDADDAGSAPVRERLSPSAYPDDLEADAEYRTLTAGGLRAERDARIAACRAELSEPGEIDLAAPDAGRRWIQVLNDLRLALGTRLGISEDDEAGLDPTDPDVQPRTVYYWLTAVQDEVVQALMR